jgi:hypothetical protein
VSDLYSAAQVLSKPIPNPVVRGRGFGPGTAKVNFNFPPGPYQAGQQMWTEWTRVQLIANMKVVNPNLNLAQRLGLTNPLTVMFELIPFSFVAGWFVNFEQVLAQYTDFMGISFEQPMTTTMASVMTYELWGVYAWSITCRAISMQRVSGITGPVLKVNPSLGINLGQATTSVALLVQQLANLDNYRWKKV